MLKIDVACPFRVEKTGTDVKNATVELYNAAVELRKTTAARIASGGLEIKNRIAAIFT